MYRYGIERFLEYDYIGAPWPTDLGVPGCVGNGGFSIRTIATIKKCLQQIHDIHIPKYANYDMDYSKLRNHPEDIVYVYGMKQLRGILPTTDIAKQFSIETCMFHKTPMASHQLDRFHPTLYQSLLLNSVMPYYVKKKETREHHRFGWNNVYDTLEPLFINHGGIEFDTWADCNYIQHPHTKRTSSWVGIMHLTPIYAKKYFKGCDIMSLLTNGSFMKDLHYCKGLFVLSTYMKECVADILKRLHHENIPIDVLYHPIPLSSDTFDFTTIPTIQRVVLIGCQLRRISTIYKLQTPHKKWWLPGYSQELASTFLQEELEEYDISLTQEEIDSVTITHLSETEYDNMLMSSFVIMDVYDASANNTLIECIAKSIPIFVRKLPAIQEYIGERYPLFFESIEELEEKLMDHDLIISAHHYLVANAPYRERLTMDYFIRSILNSTITKQILSLS
jgi:hypothetical protein